MNARLLIDVVQRESEKHRQKHGVFGEFLGHNVCDVCPTGRPGQPVIRPQFSAESVRPFRETVRHFFLLKIARTPHILWATHMVLKLNWGLIPVSRSFTA